MSGQPSSHSHGHGSGKAHITQIINEEVSELAPYSGLILVIILIVYFLLRYYVFEKFLLRRLYGDVYRNLNENQRRGFVNHHIAALAKVIMLATAAYPFFTVISARHSMHHPFLGSPHVTLGDSEQLLGRL